MSHLPEKILGNGYNSTYSYEVLKDLVDIGNRMAGQSGEVKGANRVIEAFEDIGLRRIERSEFDIDGWWRDSSELFIEGGYSQTYTDTHEVIALPGTPSKSVTAELVDAGYGRPTEFEDQNFEGKIALVSSETPDDFGRWIHRMEKYASAISAGADGFVFRNHVEGCLPPTGEIGYNNRPGPIPAVGVSKEVGATLERKIRNGGLNGSLTATCRNESATSHNITGELGPGTEEVILLTAHIDAHDIASGAGDNGAGTVLVIETARLLEQIEDDLETRVRCVVFGSEEIGLQGAYHLRKMINTSRVKAVLNIDGAGRNRILGVNTNQFEDIADVFTEATDKHSSPLDSNSTIVPHGDQWAFVQEGIPGAMITSTDPDQNGRGWGHTHADTLDKLDIRDLREHAILISEIVCSTAEADRAIARRSPKEIQGLIEEGYEKELKIGGRWPYS